MRITIFSTYCIPLFDRILLNMTLLLYLIILFIVMQLSMPFYLICIIFHGSSRWSGCNGSCYEINKRENQGMNSGLKVGLSLSQTDDLMKKKWLLFLTSLSCQHNNNKITTTTTAAAAAAAATTTATTTTTTATTSETHFQKIMLLELRDKRLLGFMVTSCFPA